jgi:hypothetical protein
LYQRTRMSTSLNGKEDKRFSCCSLVYVNTQPRSDGRPRVRARCRSEPFFAPHVRAHPVSEAECVFPEGPLARPQRVAAGPSQGLSERDPVAADSRTARRVSRVRNILTFHREAIDADGCRAKVSLSLLERRLTQRPLREGDRRLHFVPIASTEGTGAVRSA